jgi:hypothetical protein
MDTNLPSASREPRQPLTSDPDVGRFLASVRDEYRTPLPREVTSAHLRVILAASAAAPEAPALRERLGRGARRVAAIGAVKIALTATAAAAATGTGLAATGNLPADVQTVVSTVADRVGISIPTAVVEGHGDRDGLPGIGRGGVPGLIDSGAGAEELPGNTGEAPGLDRGGDGVPVVAEGAPGRSGEAPGARPDDAGARAEDRPGGATAGNSGDTPAAERPAPGEPAQPEQAEQRPAAPADGGAEGEAEERPEPANRPDTSRGSSGNGRSG